VSVGDKGRTGMDTLPTPKGSLGAPQNAPPQSGEVEAFDNDEQLAQRTNCTVFQVRKLIRLGHLRQAGATANQRFFRTADLNSAAQLAQRLIDIQGVHQAVKHLSGSERERMFFAHLSARENGRERPNEGDRVEGTRRAALKAKLDGQLDRAALRIDQMLAAIEALDRRPAGGRLRLRAVRSDAGLLQGVCVLTAGVQTIGKFVFVDANGQITKDPTAARKKLPVWTDAESLTSLLAAVREAGGKLRVRSDHDDTIAARAGTAENFQREGDKVTCDIELNDSYRDRDIVLEVATKTPDLLGCSISFTPVFEIKADRALMRIATIEAVDLVDEPAANPSGLFPD